MQSPNSETKIGITEKLSAQYNAKEFSESQLQLAEQIFRLLLKQAEVEVRKALSENLMNNRAVPTDVILSLAKDVEEVAVPVLQFSEVLTDDDLVEIVKSSEQEAAQVAIANRSNVSEKVSSALVSTENENVVGNLVRNQGASISEESYNHVVDTFPQHESIVESMLTRGTLPARVIKHMTMKVSSVIQNKLESKYNKSFDGINEFFKESGEIAALKFQESIAIDNDLIQLVDDLERNGQLENALQPANGMLSQLLDGIEQVGQMTPIAALQRGHLTLFEIGISRMTGIPFGNIHKLMQDSDGFQALYERAQLPPHFIEAVKLVIKVIKEMNQEAKKDPSVKRPQDDMYMFVKRIGQASRGQDIPNLAHFIDGINRAMENVQSEW